MSTPFEKYSDILLEAYISSDRADDLATKKKEILDELFGFFPVKPVDVLFVGFSPSLLKVTEQKIHVTQISETVKNYLNEQGVKYTYVDFNSLTPTKDFCAVVAVDEYFTFAETDIEQRNMVEQLVGLTSGFIITTLKDYKNQDFREKEFSYPVLVRDNKNKKIFFEQYEYNHIDRNVCVGTNYVVDDDSVMVVGPFSRRAMFFKQLAKFSLDAGAKNFLVHKNLMHKSIIKKNYEHIITIQL
jgi:hypothetical protein